MDLLLLSQGRSTDFGNFQYVFQFHKSLILDCSALIFSAHHCGIDVLELLLKGGADLNARTKWGDNALHYAARRGTAEVMRFLVDKGIEIGKTKVRFLTDRSYIEN